MLQYQLNFEKLKVPTEQHKFLSTLEDILVYLVMKKPRTKLQLHFDDLNLVNDRYFKNRMESLIKDDYIAELRPYSDQSQIMNHPTDSIQRLPSHLLNESSIDNYQFGQQNIPCKKEYISILNDCKDYIIELQEYLVGTLKLNQVPIVELVDDQINIYCNQEGFQVIKQAKEYFQSIYFTKIPNNDSIIPLYIDYLLKKPFLHCAQQTDKSEKYDTFIIYGKSEEAQSRIEQLNNIYFVEVVVSMFRIFSILFIPQIQEWCRKHYLVIIESDQDEVYKLVGPYDQVIKVQEAIMSEFRKFDISIGPLKLREITKDQFTMIQVHKFFQNQQTIVENIGQGDLHKNYLQSLSNQSFQACLFVEFNNKCIFERDSLFQCNFHHPEIQSLIQMELESEAQGIADQQITGSCVIYIIIVQDSVRKLEFKRQFTEYLTLVDVVINDPFLSQQLYSNYSRTIEYQDKFHVEIDCKANKVYLKGRKEDTDKLIKDLEEHCFYNQSVKDVFDFENEFYWRICRCVYQDKLNELELLYQCTIERLENPLIKLKATRKNIGTVKQELVAVLDNIRNYILCCEVKIERNAKCKVRNLIRGIEQKYQAVEITDGDCQGGHLVPQFQYKMNKAIIKVCAGSPVQLLTHRGELSQLQDAVFITFSLKDNQNRHSWEEELKALGKIITISGEQSQELFNSAKIQVKCDKMVSGEQDDFQELVFKEDKNKKKKQKEKEKEKELIVSMEFYKIWTTDMSNPIYYHTYFDKITMERSFEEAIISVFLQKSPKKLFISISEDQDFRKIIREFIMNLEKYGSKKVEIYLIGHFQQQIDALNEEIATIQGIKEENSDKMKRITQNFMVKAHSKITLECAVEDLTNQLS